MKRYRSLVRITVWLLAMAGGLSCLGQAPLPTSSASAPTTMLSAMEGNLLGMTNAARSAHGLSLLKWDDRLAEAARIHAGWMLEGGQLSHQLPAEPSLAVRAAQAGAHFQAIAENIADGPDMTSIQNGWMHSPPHRANILDPNLNAVGFAVIQHNSYFYAVADFSRTVPTLSLEEVEAAVGKLLVARGVRIGGQVRDARQSCEMSHGSAGGSKPRFIMRWQGADLTRLPADLEEQLQTKEYGSAAVGACSSANAESGFSSYRVAVLLY